MGETLVDVSNVYDEIAYSDFWFTHLMELVVIFLIMYCLAKYVFLEKLPSGKRATISYCIMIAAAFACGEYMDSGQGIVFLCVFATVLHSRKNSKWIALVETIPSIGLLNGLLLPVVMLPSRYLENQPEKAAIYRSIIYAMILLGFALFVVLGREWRKKFDEELTNRSLAKWEYAILAFAGLLLVIFSGFMSQSLKSLGIDSLDKGVLSVFSIWISIAAFFIAVIAITSVIVGNKQNFYYSKVADMQFNIIVMMAEIVENRDENTGGHIQRTAKYVEIIAKQLKKEGKFKDILTNEYINDMMVAAPLHDIGKIHVSDVILNKPGRLDEEEFAIMQSHAEEGRKLLIHAKEHLGDFSYLDIAVQMAGCHHEWWDGSKKGYPDHKHGDNIPLCARIMAVADVFDALTSKRCYKEAMPLEKAYSIISEESGTHFDSVVVDAFFAATPQIEAAYEHFCEVGNHNCIMEALDEEHHHM